MFTGADADPPEGGGNALLRFFVFFSTLTASHNGVGKFLKRWAIYIPRCSSSRNPQGWDIQSEVREVRSE